MNIEHQLKEIGLHGSEIKTYLYLLQNGLSSPPQIARGTNIARPNCYTVLQSLKEKGLIQEQRKGKRNVYTANDPVAFIQILDRRRQAMNEMLGDLRALYSKNKNKPEIRFYEGFAQVKEIFWQTLEAKEIFGIASTKQLFSHSEKFFDRYRTELWKRKVVFHDILTFASKSESGLKAKSQLKGFLEMKYLPEKYGDVPIDILIWNDNVSLIHSCPLNNPIG